MLPELRRMSRKDLLEVLIRQSKKIDELTLELDKTKKELEDKNIDIKESGSLAEASLKLNKIFNDADLAAKQYIENIKKLNDKLEKEAAKTKKVKCYYKEPKKKKSNS